MSSPFDDDDLFACIDEKSVAGADLTAEIVNEFRRAFAAQKAAGLTQKAVADRLSTSKSAVHRWLYGDGNMTIRKVGELAWAIGVRPTFSLTMDLSAVDTGTAVSCKESLPAIDVAAIDEPDRRQWFRIQPIEAEELKRFQAAIEPSASQMNFIGRNSAGLLRQCIWSTENGAVGYLETCDRNMWSTQDKADLNHYPNRPRAASNRPGVAAQISLRDRARTTYEAVA